VPKRGVVKENAALVRWKSAQICGVKSCSPKKAYYGRVLMFSVGELHCASTLAQQRTRSRGGIPSKMNEGLPLANLTAKVHLYISSLADRTLVVAEHWWLTVHAIRIPMNGETSGCTD
jgi:hypothetical protein